MMLNVSVLTDHQLASDLTLSQFLRQLYDQGLVVPGETCVNLCLRQASGDKQVERQNNGLLSSIILIYVHVRSNLFLCSSLFSYFCPTKLHRR